MASTAVRPSSLRPNAYEDGNWVCEDPACGNVNYPRRSECNKCRKPRGPAGDAIVEEYMKNKQGSGGKRSRTEGLLGAPQEGMPPQTASYGVPSQGAAYGSSSQSLAYAGSYAAPSAYVAGPSYQMPAIQMPMIQMPASHSASTPAAEGKRIAEHLLSLFGSSEDPFSDASDCLASATLWLHSLKPRGAQQPPPPSSTNGGGSYVAYQTPQAGQVQMQYPPGNVIYTPMPRAPVMYSSPHGGGAPGGGAVGRVNRPVGVKFEDYKDRPSEFLKEFGDPAVGQAARGQPTAGVNGNWKCEQCPNVNYPRRTHCKTCNEKRGEQGDEIVREYVRHLIEG